IVADGATINQNNGSGSTDLHATDTSDLNVQLTTTVPVTPLVTTASLAVFGALSSSVDVYRNTAVLIGDLSGNATAPGSGAADDIAGSGALSLAATSQGSISNVIVSNAVGAAKI